MVSSRTFSGETDFRGCCALHVSGSEEYTLRKQLKATALIRTKFQ